MLGPLLSRRCGHTGENGWVPTTQNLGKQHVVRGQRVGPPVRGGEDGEGGDASWTSKARAAWRGGPRRGEAAGTDVWRGAGLAVGWRGLLSTTLKKLGQTLNICREILGSQGP